MTDRTEEQGFETDRRATARGDTARPEQVHSVEERVRARRAEGADRRARSSCVARARQHSREHEGENSVPPAPLFDAPVTLEDDERSKRAARTEREHERSHRSVKDVVLDKTPQRLRNPSNIQVRFRTGFVYVAASVVLTLAGDVTTMLMVAILAGISANEFYYMLRSDAKLPNELLGVIAAALYPVSYYFAGMNGALVLTVGFLMALLIWYVFWMRARVSDVGVSFFGAAYCGLLLTGLLMVRMSLPGIWGGLLALLVQLSVWANDSFAYLVGSRFGKHKLAPRTSPKKSWEGLIAGLAGSMLMWAIMTFIPGVHMPLPFALLFGLVCGLSGVLGDLAESRIKRNSGFKDSGTIMPGHGGLLDRCDSLFLVSATSAILLVGSGSVPYLF